MIDVYIIEELEKERRRDRRGEVRVWVPDPRDQPEHDEPRRDWPDDQERRKGGVIIIDL